MGTFKVKQETTLSRSDFFVLLKVLILNNFKIEFEQGTSAIFKCKTSGAATIKGATVTDLPSSNPAFQSVQCLVDNNFATVPGMISGGLIRPGDSLKRGELYAITDEILNQIMTKLNTISNNGNCMANNQLNLKRILQKMISELSLSTAAFAQVTSLSQFTDIDGSSPYYSAVQSLIERYGIITGYPHFDSTLRPETDATYADVVELWSSALDRVTETGNNLSTTCN